MTNPNVEDWTRANSEYTDARAEASWAEDEITYGVFNVPESELHALPDVLSGAITASPGDRPNCLMDARSRLGWVMLTGADRPSVDRSWTAVRELVKFS